MRIVISVASLMILSSLAIAPADASTPCSTIPPHPLGPEAPGGSLYQVVRAWAVSACGMPVPSAPEPPSPEFAADVLAAAASSLAATGQLVSQEAAHMLAIVTAAAMGIIESVHHTAAGVEAIVAAAIQSLSATLLYMYDWLENTTLWLAHTIADALICAGSCIPWDVLVVVVLVVLNAVADDCDRFIGMSSPCNAIRS